jgi:Na+/H+ antiporter NhaD/arsenite permease-like protein
MNWLINTFKSSVGKKIMMSITGLGFCGFLAGHLGGNLTMIGASANIVSVGMAKRFNQTISFLQFMRFSVVITVLTLTIASGYLMLYLWISL